MVSARYSERPAPLLCIEVWERHKFKTQAAVILRDDRTPITRTQDRMNCATGRCPARVDAVEKSLAIIGFAIGGRFRLIPGRALPPDRRTPEPTCQASYAIDAHTPSVGGPSRRSAIVLRFCTMAAR